MKSGLQVAGAIGVGYLLGRTHKTRLAIALGVAAATGQLGRAPGALMERGTKALAGAGALGQVTEPGQRLLEASKAAAMAALTSRIDTVSHVLSERADALGAPTVPRPGKQDSDEQEPDEQEAEEPQDASVDEQEEDEEDEQEETEDEGEPEEAEAEAEEPPEKPKTGARRRKATTAPVRRAAR